MSANGISTLPTKQERQLAKLDIAAARRQGYSDVVPTGSQQVSSDYGGVYPNIQYTFGSLKVVSDGAGRTYLVFLSSIPVIQNYLYNSAPIHNVRFAGTDHLDAVNIVGSLIDCSTLVGFPQAGAQGYLLSDSLGVTTNNNVGWIEIPNGRFEGSGTLNTTASYYRTYNVLDITLLPDTYNGNESGADDNPNVGGPQPGRPWTTGTPGLTPYPQRTNYAFDFITPPTSGALWNDDVNQVSIAINGTAVRASNYGRGIVFNGIDTHLIINNITDGISTLTLSMAADFQSAGTYWNSVYHGGLYGGNDIFAYIGGGNTDSIAVGTVQNFDTTGPIVNNVLAWWDFVYSGTSVKVYKNGVEVTNGTLSNTNTGFTSALLIGKRYDSDTDFLNGTIYRIKGVLSALTPGQIVTQYNSIASTYGLTPVTVTYTLTSDGSVDEGGGLTFTASGTNVPNGEYYWTIETNSGDFAVTSGALGVENNYGSFIVGPNADATTEGSETFTVALRSGSISGPILVTSDPITINDTSTAPPPGNYSFVAREYHTNTGYNSSQGANEISVLIADYPNIVNVPAGATVTWGGNSPGSITVTGGDTVSGVYRFGVSTLSFNTWGNDELTFTWTV